MLTLTPQAAEVVRSLVEESPDPTSAGLRIAAAEAAEEGVALELTLVAEPEALDATVEQSGATVYLDPGAAELLDDKLLDAQVAEDQVTFVLREDADDGAPFAPLEPRADDAHRRRNGHTPH